MKRIIALAVLLTTLMSCAKEEVITPDNVSKDRLKSVSISGQWQMISYSVNGDNTFGDGSLWNFDSNGQLIISNEGSEIGYSYSTNGLRIYIIDNVNDTVIEYFIDYLDSSLMTISAGNKSYTFTRY